MAANNGNNSMTPLQPLGEAEKKLLQALAQQTGADLRALEAGYRSGNLQAMISALPADKRGAALRAVNDPAKMEAAKKMAQSGGLNGLLGKGK